MYLGNRQATTSIIDCIYYDLYSILMRCRNGTSISLFLNTDIAISAISFGLLAQITKKNG